MGATVNQYEVIRECYVPIGPGLRYKRPGNVVTLSDAEAGKLASYIKPVEPEKPKRGRVAKRNTSAPTDGPTAELVGKAAAVETDGEVILDGGDQSADHE